MTSSRNQTPLSPTHPLFAATGDSALVRAWRGQTGNRIPVWFMRQAGRSLPEYRQARGNMPMLEACLDVEAATEITLQPVRRHGVDAAILFSDIVLPLYLAGVGVDIVAGRGPVFAQPLNSREQINKLTQLPIEAELFEPVARLVRSLVGELGAIPLIGFAGAPFTLAAYLVAGGPSKDRLEARTLMHADPQTWQELMDWLARLSGTFLQVQVRAGASAAQLFDSWAGALNESDYRRYAAPHSAKALRHVNEIPVPGENPQPIPTAHFGVATSHLLTAMAGVGAGVLGLDWRSPISAVAAAFPRTPLQGNLDPALLAAPWPVIEEAATEIVRGGAAAQSHTFNLGHGVPQSADPTVLTRLTEWLHEVDLREVEPADLVSAHPSPSHLEPTQPSPSDRTRRRRTLS